MKAMISSRCYFFFFQAEDGIRDSSVTGVQTCALPILAQWRAFGEESVAIVHHLNDRNALLTKGSPLRHLPRRLVTERALRCVLDPGGKIGRASCRERV